MAPESKLHHLLFSRRPASVLAATLALFAASAGFHNVSAAALSLSLSPLHRNNSPAFHADTFNPARPPRLQTGNAPRTPVDRHARHRTL